MRVSQLIHAMDRDEEIIIEDGNKRITRMRLYEGTVRGIKRDDPINRMHVNRVIACDNVMVVLANGESENRFSPKEVRKMTPRAVRENYTAIMNSMKEWH